MGSTPVVLVTGVAVEAMETATIALQWDLPNAVVVSHRIDVGAARLRRTVSDVTGVLEQNDVDLAHACVNCAIREDIIPTLERLVAAKRWDVIVAHLPVAAEATQVCRVLAGDRRRYRGLRVGAVVCAVDGARAVDDLLGDDLLRERGLHAADDDDRGLAEVNAAMVEYADVVTVAGDAGTGELELLRALVRPDAEIHSEGTNLDVASVRAGMHDARAAESWVAPAGRRELPQLDGDQVWRLELTSDRPFHPRRLYENIERLGGGPRRSRGCFWLPTRPAALCVWDGAGGQLSIGAPDRWGLSRPFTRIVVTGMDDGRAEIEAAFQHCLLNDAEVSRRGTFWEVEDDGFEAWLGDIRDRV
jgi:G3E family GTPase